MNKNDIEKKLIERVEDELSEIDMEKRYDEMLDECSECCATCRNYGASRILKEMDPVAYRCGFNDWLDGEVRGNRDLTEINEKVYEASEVQDIRDELEADADEEEQHEADKEST